MTLKLAVGVLTAITTTLWLPYVILDFALFDALGTELGMMLGTVLAIIGVYDIAVKAGVTCYFDEGHTIQTGRACCLNRIAGSRRRR